MTPDYIGPLTPQQLVEIRLGRFTRYESEGGGHGAWDEENFPCGARVGSPEGEHPNEFYTLPFQPLWVPAPGAAGEWKPVPNVKEVKLDKSLQDLIGIGGTCTVQVENIAYLAQAGGHHVRARGYYSPLRGVIAAGLPALLDEWGEIIETNEWEGRFSYEAQIIIRQGFGEPQKTFTGLIENIDSTSRPDRIVITAMDYGIVFEENHFFGWNKDPVINTPVIFEDSLRATSKRYSGYNANASQEDKPDHEAAEVLDFDESSWWQTNVLGSAEQTEYVEIALKKGRYRFADIAARWGGMEVYVALRPAEISPGQPAERNGTILAGEWLDENGWVDPTKKGGEAQVPGEEGGHAYTNHFGSYPAGQQRTPIDSSEAEYDVGDNTIMRLSFRKLHKVEAGENYRAGVQEFHGLREEFTEAVARQEWVTTEDIADVIRILCIWAGFKEWDIPDTGTRLPKRIVASVGMTYLDVIKQVCEGIGFIFYMADPDPENDDSLGIPTFRKSHVSLPDTIESLPVIADRELLTSINVKQTNATLAYVIRVYGKGTQASRTGEPPSKRLVYTFRPPWAGTPPTYSDSRLAGVLKQVVYENSQFTTKEQIRNAAWQIALDEAIASCEATIEFPAKPELDLDDHALLKDLGTGLSTRIALYSRSSTFVDGERKSWTMSIGGPLIDTPDVADMAKIKNDEATANGAFNEWANPTVGTPSSLGYG